MAQAEHKRIGVIGAGYWGQNLVRVFSELGALALVCDAREEVQERLKQHYPGLQVCSNVETLLEADIDGVVIATPSSSHAQLALQALAAGKHIFVEKPLALTKEEAQAIAEQAKQQDKQVLVGHLMLYHPCLLAARELVQRGDIGRPLYLYGRRVNLGRVRMDENVLWSLGPHDLSMVNYLLDYPKLERARASGIICIDKAEELEDVVFAQLLYEGGLSAHFHFSWLDPDKRRELVVVGEEKMLVFDDMQPREKLRIYDKSVQKRREDDYQGFMAALSVRSGEVYAPDIAMTEPLKLEAKDFLEALTSGQTPRSSIQSGLAVVEALEELSKDLKHNRSIRV